MTTWTENDVTYSRVHSHFKMARMVLNEDEMTHKSRKECLIQPKYVSLFVQSIVTFTIALSISLYPPFYPRLAEQKGASTALYGFVLGSNCLTAFIITPVIGRHLGVIGIRFAYIMGICINGVCCILTGFLDVVPPGVSFITLSLAIRVINAVGNAGVITASFSILANDFTENLSIVFASNRLVMNMGQLGGPALGGALFELGGFRLPFLVLGIAQLFAAFISILFLPKCEVSTKAGDSGKKNLTVWNFFKIPSIYVAFSVFLVSTMASGFLSVTLEPYILRPYNLNNFHMGLIFGIKDGASSLFTPLWGYLCNNPRAVKPCVLICCAVMIVSYVVLGPFPGIELNQTKELLCVILGLYGAGIAGLQVSGVIDAFHEVREEGYPDDATTHGCVAGLWSSFSGLGRFVSRSTSGILVDYIGFQMSTIFVVGLLCIVVCLTLIFMVCCRRKAKKMLLTRFDSEKLASDITSNKLMASYEFHRSRNFVAAL